MQLISACNRKESMKQDQIVIYKDENNAIQLEVRMDGEMIWLTRQASP